MGTPEGTSSDAKVIGRHLTTGGLVLSDEIRLVGGAIVCDAFETLEDTGCYDQILDQLKQHADEARPLLARGALAREAEAGEGEDGGGEGDHYAPLDEPLASAILNTVTAGQCTESASPFQREDDFPVQSLHRFGNGRRLGVVGMVGGAFLALLPPGAAAGDAVCILNNSCLPCLLRPGRGGGNGDGDGDGDDNERSWQYVGWVYLRYPGLHRAIEKRFSGDEGTKGRTGWPMYREFDIV